MAMRLKAFIGWDPHEIIAYDVARYSIERRSSIQLSVTPLIQSELVAAGVYCRDHDPLASTEFTYTRFLTPYLAGSDGWALYCDCDFLWLADVAELVTDLNPAKAIYCVQHNYWPPEKTKMSGARQTVFPRKNWSSLMVFNTAHRACRALTPDIINRATSAFLHRMQWVPDTEIGALPVEWNWLEGWNNVHRDGPPKAIHFTRGGPWHANWRDVQFADLWQKEREAFETAIVAR